MYFIINNNDYWYCKAPWSLGRMHVSCILSEGARSNPVANYEERETSERKIEIGNEKRKKKEGAPANDL